MNEVPNRPKNKYTCKKIHTVYAHMRVRAFKNTIIEANEEHHMISMQYYYKARAHKN